MIKNWIVRVCEITDSKKWVNDPEAESSYSKDHTYGVLADSPEKALEEIKIQWLGRKWWSISTNEPVGKRSFHTHTIWNDDLYDKVHFGECGHKENDTITIPGTNKTFTICHNCGEEI